MTTETDTAPQSAKDLVRAALESLPDDATLDDILDEVYVQEKIRQGVEDAKAGRSFTTEEVRALLAKWRESDG